MLFDADSADAVDAGLLEPVRAGTAVEAGSRARFDALDLARRARGAGNPVVPLVRESTAAVRALDPAGAEHERPAGAWHAEWQPLRAALRPAGGAAETAAEPAEGLEVLPDRMRADLEPTGGRIVSERPAGESTAEFGNEAARSLLTDASGTSARTGRPLRDLLGRLDEAVFDPAAYIGSAPALIDRALAHHRTVLQEKDQ
ncbi:hypothetical protein [Embleya sp. NPDC050493]|uniref:hypothetical protein n=1 Tax=Embleya sp. NPDC050493 TaxID=3363989 RepID=UPI0037ADA41F